MLCREAGKELVKISRDGVEGDGDLKLSVENGVTPLAMGMKFPDPPFWLGLKCHDPPAILPSIVTKMIV